MCLCYIGYLCSFACPPHWHILSGLCGTPIKLFVWPVWHFMVHWPPVAPPVGGASVLQTACLSTTNMGCNRNMQVKPKGSAPFTLALNPASGRPGHLAGCPNSCKALAWAALVHPWGPCTPMGQCRRVCHGMGVWQHACMPINAPIWGAGVQTQKECTQHKCRAVWHKTKLQCKCRV